MRMPSIFGQGLLMFLLAVIGWADTVAPTWESSSYFQTGSATITSLSSTNQSFVASYATALTAAPTRKVVIGFPDLNFALGTNYFQIYAWVSAYSQTNFNYWVATRTASDVHNIKIIYLVVDPSFSEPFSCFGASFNTTINGPDSATTYVNFTASTGVTINTAHSNGMIAFMNMFDISSATDCYEIQLEFSVHNSSYYKVKLETSCQMTFTKFVFSRIIFDETAIEAMGTNYFDFGTITSAGSAPLTLTLQNLVASNFIIGLKSFRIPRSQASIVFSSAIGDTTTITVNDCTSITFQYWTFRQRKCPATHTYFDIPTQMCYDVCQDRLYGNSSLLCSPCKYTCKQCTGSTTCTECDEDNDHRYLSGNQCIPKLGYYESNVAVAAACMDQCVSCTNGTGCTLCKITYARNTADGTCSQCSNFMTGCEECNGSKTICLSCLPEYTFNASSDSCYLILCTDATCEDCTTNISICLDCPAGTVNDQGICFTSACTDSGCLSCPTDPVCQLCGSNYDLNGGICVACTDPRCMNCSFDNTFCLDCFEGYANDNGTCVLSPCDDSDCLICPNPSVCDICGFAYGFQLLTCKKCTDVNCLNCYDDNTFCTLCISNETNNRSMDFFANSTSGQCQLCAVDHCLDCSALQECQKCDVESGYLLNQTSLQCEVCTLDYCLNCSSLTVCIECDESSQYYLNESTNLCIPCPVFQCVSCASIDTCGVCNQSNGYFLNSTSQLCQPCAVEECEQCWSLTKCFQCNTTNGYFLNHSDFQCYPCALEGCQTCESIDSCLVCNSSADYGFDLSFGSTTYGVQGNIIKICGTCEVSCICDGYNLPWTGTNCTPVCGDSLIRLTEQCDDGNINNGDGCDSACQVEEYYNCTGEPSQCVFVVDFILALVSTTRSGCNQVTIVVSVYPMIDESLLQPRTYFSNTTNITISKMKFAKSDSDEDNGTITITADYSQDVHGQLLTLHVDPSSIDFVYEPLLPALYYLPIVCSNQRQMTLAVKAAVIGSSGVLIVSLVGAKIVGLELFGILQLAYFTMSDQSFILPYLASLSNFSILNGPNINIGSPNTNMPAIMQEMGFKSTFLGNINIMLVLLVAPLLAGLAINRFGWLTASHKLKRASKLFLKQGLITMIIFNAYNISFSTVLHLKYSSPQEGLYILSWFSMLLSWAIILLALIQMIASYGSYGEFKKSFKYGCECQLYIPLTIAYRLLLGACMALIDDKNNNVGLLLIVSIPLVFLVYNAVNLPFTGTCQNYRASFIHIAELVIIYIANFYGSIKDSSPIQEKARLNTPVYIQCGLFTICFILSLCVLLYQFSRLLKDTSSNKVGRRHEQTEESLDWAN